MRPLLQSSRILRDLALGSQRPLSQTEREDFWIFSASARSAGVIWRRTSSARSSSGPLVAFMLTWLELSNSNRDARSIRTTPTLFELFA